MAGPNFLWSTVPSVINLLTAELNTMASGSGTALGPEIDNTSSAWQVGRLHLHIASNSLAFVAASNVQIAFLSSNAGSTYPTYTSGASYKLALSNYLVATMNLNPATQSANVVDEWIEGVFIPAGKFKALLIYNGGGAGSWPGTLNTLDLFPTPSQY